MSFGPLRSLTDRPPKAPDMTLALRQAVQQEKSDRGAALVIGPITERILRGAVRLAFRIDTDEKLLKRLFGEHGALFNIDKISQIARAINLIGPETWNNLDIIRLIRNQFAHAPSDIDFA
jgi:hypothetical protein